MKKRGLLTTILFLAIAGSLLALIFKQEPLPEYHEEPQTVVESTPTYQTAGFMTDTYSLQVPSDWVLVEQNGVTSFVDAKTASTIEISSMTYSPIINTLNAESVKFNIESAGLNFFSYDRLSNCCYKAEYTDESIAYIEWVYWDLGTIYTLTCKYEPQYYDPIYALADYCLRSFAWNGDKIPTGYRMEYIEFGNFALLVKDSWGINVKENKTVINDPETGMSISVFVEENEADYSRISQLEYTDRVAINKDNFLQSSFVNTGSAMSAIATYTVGGELIDYYEYCIARNGFNYDIVLQYCDKDASLLTDDHRLFIDYFITY